MPVVLLAASAGSACGKKGPPLAPLLEVPAAVQDIAARRTGDNVELQFRVPNANSDGTRPADIRRVEVYGFTGPLPSNRELLKYGTLVASVPVRPPPEEDEDETSGDKAGKAPASAARPPASLEAGFDQGGLVVFAEPLGPEQLKQAVVARPDKRPPVPPPDPWQPLLAPERGPADTRLYVFVGVNHKGQRGAFSPPQSVSLRSTPASPEAPVPTYDEKDVTLWWTPSPGAARPIQEPAEEGMLASTPRGLQSGSSGYNVYLVPPGDLVLAPTVSRRPEAGTLPKPLNEKPLVEGSFSAPVGEWGKERCFGVSLVVDSAGQAVESPPSSPACVTPLDTFPPSPPKGVSAVGSEGAVSLIWEGNTEPDLAGYLVLRREASAAAYAPVTPQPIKETTFRDTTVAKGMRYSYVVVAVDAAGNRSAPSDAVEENAR